MVTNPKETKSNQASLSFSNIAFRVILGVAVLVSMLYFGYGLLDDALGYYPQLRISGGLTTGTRHLLARSIEKEVDRNGLEMQTIPTPGAFTALQMANEGSLDFVVVPSGMPNDYPNLVQVATINPMPIVFFVDESIKSIEDLKGQKIEMGLAVTGNPAIIKPILSFLKLKLDVDYVETNFGAVQLERMPRAEVPNVVIDINYPPAELGEYLISKFHYHILTMDLADTLKLRYPAFENQSVQNNTYGEEPEKDIPVVGVLQNILANKNVDKRFVFKVLDALYSPAVAAAMQIKYDQKFISEPSGYKLSDGTADFISRSNFVVSPDLLARLKAWSELLLILIIGTILLRLISDTRPKFDDAVLRGYFAEVAQIEQKFGELSITGQLTTEAVIMFSNRLSEIKKKAMESLPKASRENKGNISELIICISDARNAISGDGSASKVKDGSSGIFGMLKNVAR
jgi:TRAP-type uncharacterized transport system substrate-binding protein